MHLDVCMPPPALLTRLAFGKRWPVIGCIVFEDEEVTLDITVCEHLQLAYKLSKTVALNHDEVYTV